MALTLSQHRKLVREGKIAPEGRSTKDEVRKRRPEAQSPKPKARSRYSVLAADAVARRLAVCQPCPHRVVSAVGAAGERWLCLRSELPDFRCPRTMDLRRKAAIAEAVCYEGKWEE